MTRLLIGLVLALAVAGAQAQCRDQMDVARSTMNRYSLPDYQPLMCDNGKGILNGLVNNQNFLSSIFSSLASGFLKNACANSPAPSATGALGGGQTGGCVAPPGGGGIGGGGGGGIGGGGGGGGGGIGGGGGDLGGVRPLPRAEALSRCINGTSPRGGVLCQEAVRAAYDEGEPTVRGALDRCTAAVIALFPPQDFRHGTALQQTARAQCRQTIVDVFGAPVPLQQSGGGGDGSAAGGGINNPGGASGGLAPEFETGDPNDPLRRLAR